MFRQMQSRPTGSVPPVCFVYRRILPSSSLIGSHGMLTTCSRVLRNIRPRQSRLNCWEASDATTHLPRSSTLVDPKFKPSPTIGLARTIIAGPPRSNSAEWRGLSTAQPEMEEDTGLASVFLEYDVSPVHLIHTMLDAVKLKSTDTYIDLYVIFPGGKNLMAFSDTVGHAISCVQWMRRRPMGHRSGSYVWL